MNKFKSMVLVCSINCQLMNKIANHFPTMPIHSALHGVYSLTCVSLARGAHVSARAAARRSIYIGAQTPTAASFHPQSARAHAQTREKERRCRCQRPPIEKGIPGGGSPRSRPSAGDDGRGRELCREAAPRGGGEEGRAGDRDNGSSRRLRRRRGTGRRGRGPRGHGACRLGATA